MPCATHARPAWQTSHRRASLPHDWERIRADILRRDPVCQLHYDGCAGRSVEVDHIGSPADHTPGNLRGVCTPCHRRRTQAQSADARRT